MNRIDIREIVMALLFRTRKDQVNWRSGENEFGGPAEDDYYVYLPNSAVNVYKRSDNGLVVAAILNKGGARIGVVDSSDQEMAPSLAELLNLAERKVLNLDATLTEIKDALRSPNQVGS